MSRTRNFSVDDANEARAAYNTTDALALVATARINGKTAFASPAKRDNRSLLPDLIGIVLEKYSEGIQQMIRKKRFGTKYDENVTSKRREREENAKREITTGNEWHGREMKNRQLRYYS